MVTINSWNSADPAEVAKGGTGRATVTAYNLMTGAGTSQVSLVAPSATSGVPVISQGAAADPIYGTAVVAGGGTGLTSTTAYAVLCGGTTSTAALQSIASVGTSGQVLTSNGAAALPTFQDATGGGSGALIKSARTQSNTQVTTTSVIPLDTSIPQITEGAEVITLAYTPSSATSTLEITATLNLGWNTGIITVALFVDSDADALSSTFTDTRTSVGSVIQTTLKYVVSAASTSARTYKIRFGSNSTETIYTNQGLSGIDLGNTLFTTLSVCEFAA